MGQGYGYKCICGYEGEILFGAGFRYPSQSAETLKDMAAGKYGKKRAALTKSGNVVVDARYDYYRCQCGYGNSYMNLDLYSSDCDDIFRPYGEAEKKYKLIMKFNHRCPKCRRIMKRIGEEGFDTKGVLCPKCGNKQLFFYNTLWD